MAKKFTEKKSIHLEKTLLLILVILNLLSRVVLLEKTPIGITHDELNYIISAKSLFWNKDFAPGTAPAILPTKMANYTVTVAEVPALILSILIGPLPLTLFTARMVGAILNTGVMLLVYFIAKEITQSKKTAITSALIFLINPWSFLMGRSIFETNFYLLFLLSALLILIKNNGWKIFYSLPLFLLGFTSYIGGQISFLAFILITLIYHYFSPKTNQNRKIVYIAYTIAVIIIFIGYTYLVLHNQTSIARGREINTPFSQEVKNIVDNKRRLSLQDHKEIFTNKASVYVEEILQRYLNAFSTNFLFIKGETRAAFSFQEHGTFYYLDFIFILLGICYLFSKDKKKFAFTVGIITIAPITSSLSKIELSYSQRAGLMFPFLIILSAIGINYLITIFSSKRINRLLTIIVLSVYTISFINLVYIYFFRFPLYASDGWFFQDRVLSRYLALAKGRNKKIFIITHEPKIIFEEYLFFNNLYHGQRVSSINQLLDEKEYSYNKITFTEDCPDNIDKDTIYALSYQIDCPILKNKNQNPLRIANIKENQELYVLFNDDICTDVALNEYNIPTNLEDFEIEKMSRHDFCQKWITQNR